MSKPHRTYNVKLIGGTYELYYDNVALYEFEEIHGKPAIHVMASGEMGFRAITHFVYAGLMHSDERYTLEEVKRMIDLKNLEQIVNVVVKAVNDALDTGEKGKPVKNSKADQQE